jgi:hypothetical protein
MAPRPPRKPTPQKPDPPNPAFSWPQFWKEFRENLKRSFVEAFEHVSELTETRERETIDVDKLALAIVKAEQLCRRPEPPSGITFSIERTDPMALICDVTVNWVDSVSTDVTGQHITTNVQVGTNPVVTVDQDLPATQAAFVVPAVPQGGVVSVALTATNGTTPSIPAKATFTVPADLGTPQPQTNITFAVGNIRDDGSGAPAAVVAAKPA